MEQNKHNNNPLTENIYKKDEETLKQELELSKVQKKMLFQAGYAALGFVVIFIGLFFLGKFMFSDTFSASKQEKRDLILTDLSNFKDNLSAWTDKYNLKNLDKEKEHAKNYQLQALQLQDKIKKLKVTDTTIITEDMAQDISDIQLLLTNLTIVEDKQNAVLLVNKLRGIAH